MSTQEYFKIGSRVKYLRHDTDLEVHEEVGIVRAIFMDQDNRLMVQVKNGENAHNVHYTSVNYNLSLVKDYKDLLQDIRSTSSEGDTLVDEIVQRYNKTVQAVTTNLLGEPIEVADLEEDEPALKEVAGNA